jgi:glycine C-acetyltransferase
LPYQANEHQILKHKDMNTIKERLQADINDIKTAGLYKSERIIASAQGPQITLSDGSKVLNFCANNYLGLSSHPRVLAAAKKALDSHGYGMSSVRFICGTQDIHKELEQKIARLSGTEDTILYAACFDANGGVFEPLFGEDDAIISDALNHASIIDGVRLCKAQRYRYENNNMEDLEKQLKDAAHCRSRIIVTDGVFSMDGTIAQLDKICDLADKYQAMVMVDDSHAVGFMGKTGRGTIEHCHVIGRVDIVTGTLGKALGGALGGYTTASKEIIEMLRQKSRPYLFSNSLAPSIVGASIEVLNLISETTDLRDALEQNAAYFRKAMTGLGFDIKPGTHPIVPLMLYDAPLAQKFAQNLLAEGIYVIGFSFPVVPKGQARIRIQLSAGHTRAHLDKAIAAFAKIGKELGVIGDNVGAGLAPAHK